MAQKYPTYLQFGHYVQTFVVYFWDPSLRRRAKVQQYDDNNQFKRQITDEIIETVKRLQLLIKLY